MEKERDFLHEIANFTSFSIGQAHLLTSMVKKSMGENGTDVDLDSVKHRLDQLYSTLEKMTEAISERRDFLLQDINKSA